MATYHVWADSGDKPVIVRADRCEEYEGLLLFFDQAPCLMTTTFTRIFYPCQWVSCAAVHDDDAKGLE